MLPWEKYFFPADIKEDIKFYSLLKSQCEDLQIYDWTNKTIQETFDFFAKAKYWVWARLHFLLLLKYLDKDFDALSYQEKIDKLIK